MSADLHRAARLLRERAKHLRTLDGRLEAGWHEMDALMVANELARQAAAILKLETLQ